MKNNLDFSPQSKDNSSMPITIARASKNKCPHFKA